MSLSTTHMSKRESTTPQQVREKKGGREGGLHGESRRGFEPGLVRSLRGLRILPWAEKGSEGKKQDFRGAVCQALKKKWRCQAPNNRTPRHTPRPAHVSCIPQPRIPYRTDLLNKKTSTERKGSCLQGRGCGQQPPQFPQDPLNRNATPDVKHGIIREGPHALKHLSDVAKKKRLARAGEEGERKARTNTSPLT